MSHSLPREQNARLPKSLSEASLAAWRFCLLNDILRDVATTETWYRNPANYIREIDECGVQNIVWDYGYLYRRKIDVHKYMRMKATGKNYRYMVIASEGAEEFATRSGDTPIAWYPVWTYEDGIDELEKLCADENPVSKRHLVVVMNILALNTPLGKELLKEIVNMQADYPKCEIMIHGTYAHHTLIRQQFKVITCEPRTIATGTILLPTGKKVFMPADLKPYMNWIRLLGYKANELDIPRNRCMFNIKSIEWAAVNYNREDNIRFNADPDNVVDYESPREMFEPVVTKTYKTRMNLKSAPGDMYVCNSCSLMFDCKLYREGAVCAVPGSEPKELAAFFKTRDSGTIIDGIAEVAQIQSDRLVQGLEREQVLQQLDPEVTKIANSLVATGEKLAKLVDPSLRNPKVAINLNGNGPTQVQIGDPRQYIAAAFREFELAGIPRSKVTPAMVENVLKGMGVTDAYNRDAGNPIHQIIELEPVKQ